MAAKRKPLVIPERLLKENTTANRKAIRELIQERLDWNKDNLPPSQYRDGIPKGKFKFGDIEIEISGASAYSRKGSPISLPTVTDAEKIRAAKLLQQTSKAGGVKKVTYGRGARGLKEAMQDHHIRFRTLFQPFYEGLNEKDAKELTEWFVQGKSPLGNVLENLEGVDADLHEELDRSIHQWAKENQIQVDQFTKEEWARGDRNIPRDPDTGKLKINKVTGKPEVRGGVDEELFIKPVDPKTGKRIGLQELKSKGARVIPQAKFSRIGGDLNARKNAARIYLDIHEEPLLNKTAEILEEQDLRYAAKDPTHKTKTKAQWLKKWDESATAGAKTSEWLEDVAEKNPDLDVRMSDIDDIRANPDAPLSKAAAKRLKIKPSGSALKNLKRLGIGGASLLGLPIIGGQQGHAAGMYQKTGDKKYLKDLGIATGRDFATGSAIGITGKAIAKRQLTKGLIRQGIVRGGLGLGLRGAVGTAVPILGLGLAAYSAVDMANQYSKATTGKGLVGHAKDLLINKTPSEGIKAKDVDYFKIAEQPTVDFNQSLSIANN